MHWGLCMVHKPLCQEHVLAAEPEKFVVNPLYTRSPMAYITWRWESYSARTRFFGRLFVPSATSVTVSCFVLTVDSTFAFLQLVLLPRRHVLLDAQSVQQPSTVPHGRNAVHQGTAATCLLEPDGVHAFEMSRLVHANCQRALLVTPNAGQHRNAGASTRDKSSQLNDRNTNSAPKGKVLAKTP